MKSEDKVDYNKMLAEYERHLIPISWSDFPLDYIQELRDRHWEAQRYQDSDKLLGWNTYWDDEDRWADRKKHRDWVRAYEVPAFHFGIYLSHDEVIQYGKQCWLERHPEATSGPMENSIPLLGHLNTRLGERRLTINDIRFYRRLPVTFPTSPDTESFICCLISTNDRDIRRRTNPRNLAIALEVIRKEFPCTADREPMWYFDRGFFEPRNFDYAEFDPERVVGSGLLARLPKHVQTEIKEGRKVQWSLLPPDQSAPSDQLAEMKLSD
ncbi:hypothetical protein L226DRAFT_573947 [Lentinus tigrinus ALCF2SS1-7]|uniref:Uncharacterized protein n=1 Tax=Lentinus tigrinus ALCF2SS1-6 TaxID=1328759 RepID=A0A5C2RZ73_9APHY|nr:hypothetical protein L227DRAFT_257758 [Lentinus tigrinus ALCF2SS1-6]RPD71475.1 hypothetical protein L226DRAFT_573947 [Lentinus tigrinus ALCF2SS1-7]